MKEFDERLQNAFASVSAEEDLKRSARAFVQEKRERSAGSSFLKSIRPAAVLACMLCVFFGGYFFRVFFEPVSVISIDINPSIELGVNAFDRVICVEAFNEDGRELVADVPLRFLNYQEAVDRIVTSETVTALIEQEEELMIAVVGEDRIRNEKLCSSLDSYTESSGSGHCYNASLQSVKHAHSCGLSYGKYLAYQEALKRDATLTPEDVQDMTMKEIHDLAGGHCHTEPTQEDTEPTQEETEAAHHGHKHKKKHH